MKKNKNLSNEHLNNLYQLNLIYYILDTIKDFFNDEELNEEILNNIYQFNKNKFYQFELLKNLIKEKNTFANEINYLIYHNNIFNLCEIIKNVCLQKNFEFFIELIKFLSENYKDNII